MSGQGFQLDQATIKKYQVLLMDYVRNLQDFVDNLVDNIQYSLNYEGSSSNPHFQHSAGIGRIGTTGFMIGLAGGIHVGLIIALFFLTHDAHGALMQWSVYMTLLCFFHFAEFFATALYQPASLSYDSFIVNHSKSYTFAALASWTEFWVESILFGSLKRRGFLMLIGIALIILGQGIRTLAMWTCGPNFNHQVMERNADDGHKLVTNGIYAYLRHPAYFGWFYWSIGTQVFLCNPICTIFYAWASWSFFSVRIPYEESLLLRAYPQQYAEYAAKTFVLIPFIKSSTNAGPSQSVNYPDDNR